jgi:glutathione S-transferase
MEYVKPEDARNMKGVRVVLTQAAFGPWGQAVKKMLELKGIPYIPVAQLAGQPNEELVKWTGTRNAPTIVRDDEAPVTRWFDQIPYINNMSPKNSFIPVDSPSRIEMFGIVHEIAGEWGFGWCRRLMMFDMTEKATKSAGKELAPMFNTMFNAYGFQAETAENAAPRVVDIIKTLSERLKAQKAKGSEFFVGKQLSAADIYWAAFSYMVELLPDDICPMPADMRELRECKDPRILAVKDPILIEHRNNVLRKYLGGKCEF